MTEFINIVQSNVVSTVAIIVAILGLITTFNEKARGFFLRKKNTNRSNAEITRDTVITTEESIRLLTESVKGATANFVLAMADKSKAEKAMYKSESEREKDKLEHQKELSKLLNEIEILKATVDKNCTNQCFKNEE